MQQGSILLSIIIPTLNESKSGYLAKILEQYQNLPHIEIICVDGGSKDDTTEVIKNSKAKLIQTNLSSRASRLNEGIAVAKNELILLHHPRSILDISGINQLIKIKDQVTWGAFTHAFDLNHPLLKFTSWYSNNVRGDLRDIFYLDHCLFAQKKLLFEVGLLPDIEIFEDTEICLKLKKKARPVRINSPSVTSAVRFEKNGFWRQAIKNQYLKWAYYLKSSDKKMNKFYEQGLELNTEDDYDDL